MSSNPSGESAANLTLGRSHGPLAKTPVPSWGIFELNPPPRARDQAAPRPSPVKREWARRSMEWFAEQEEASSAAVPEPWLILRRVLTKGALTSSSSWWDSGFESGFLQHGSLVQRG